MNHSNITIDIDYISFIGYSFASERVEQLREMLNKELRDLFQKEDFAATFSRRDIDHITLPDLTVSELTSDHQVVQALASGIAQSISGPAMSSGPGAV